MPTCCPPGGYCATCRQYAARAGIALDIPRPAARLRGADALLALEHTEQALLQRPSMVPAILPLDLELSLELQTEGNQRVHWRTAANRAKAQRLGVYNALCRYGSAHLLTGPLRITVTRIAPGLLDPRNVDSACKHIFDGITDWLTSKPGKGHYYDHDPRFQWNPQQEKGQRGVYAVHICIEET